MNIVLFTAGELNNNLPETDPRIDHVRNVLKIGEGQYFDAGILNGPRGKAKWIKAVDGGLQILFGDQEPVPELYPVDLWASFCRPQTCRRILQESTSLGVRSITFFDTEKCEPAYRKSRLWSSGEAERLLIRGAEQAFCTRIPKLDLNLSLEEALKNHPGTGRRLALDNYEAAERLAAGSPSNIPVTIAVGGERGWSGKERDALRQAGFTLCDLGPRVLRSDTACISAVSIIRMGLMD